MDRRRAGAGRVSAAARGAIGMAARPPILPTSLYPEETADRWKQICL